MAPRGGDGHRPVRGARRGMRRCAIAAVRTVKRSPPDRLEGVEPATAHPPAERDRGEPDGLDARVDRGRRAQREWRRVSLDERAAILWEIGAAIDRELEDLARLESRNVGKPLRESRGEVALAARTFRYYAGAVDKH